MLLLAQTNSDIGTIPNGFKRELETLKIFSSNHSIDEIEGRKIDVKILVGNVPQEVLKEQKDIPYLWMPLGSKQYEIFEHVCGVISRTKAEQEKLPFESTYIRPVVAGIFGAKSDQTRDLVTTDDLYTSRSPHSKVVNTARECKFPTIVTGFPTKQATRKDEAYQIRPTVTLLKEIYSKSRVFICENVRQINSAHEALACGCRVMVHNRVDLEGSGITKYNDETFIETMQKCYRAPIIGQQQTSNVEQFQNAIDSILAEILA